MKMTLRRATKLRTKLNTKIVNIESSIRDQLSISVGIVDVDVLEQLNTAQINVKNSVDRLLGLTEVQGTLRELIGEANQSHGINGILSQMAVTKHNLNMFKTIRDLVAINGTTPSEANLANRLSLVKTRMESGNSARYGGTDSMTISTVSAEYHDVILGRIDELIQSQENFQNMIEEINSRSYIDVPDSMVVTLQKEKLI